MEELTMNRLTLVPVVGLAMILALALGSLYGCRTVTTPGDGGGKNATAVCTMIHAAVSDATLDDPSTRAAIQLAATKPGVPESVRNAVDAYYRGDRVAGRHAMLTSCADVEFPS
jgi:hypothetical protein